MDKLVEKPKAYKRLVPIVVWALVLVNFLFGPRILNSIRANIYGRSPNRELVQYATNDGRSYIDGLDPSPEIGSSYQKLWGWAFLTLDEKLSPDDYKRMVVLASEEVMYEFDTSRVERKGVQSHFAELNMDLTGSGFSAVFDENILRPGLYRIIVEFIDSNGSKHYLTTNRFIEKSNNTIGLK